MAESQTLPFWSNHRLVGCFWQNTVGLIGFQYDQLWLANGGFSISQSLPLQTCPFSPESGLANRFFSNLLPEGLARDQRVRDLKIADTNFNLLKAIGGECAGALSMLEVHQQLSKKEKYFRLSRSELEQLVTQKGKFYT